MKPPEGYEKIHWTNLKLGQQYFYRWPKVGEALVEIAYMVKIEGQDPPIPHALEIIRGRFEIVGKPSYEKGSLMPYEIGAGQFYEART